MLRDIEDARIRGKLIERMRKLAIDPEKQGKRLVNELAKFRSVRVYRARLFRPEISITLPAR
jgi:hypothetical protein